MKKLLVSLVVLCFILASCCGNQGTPATEEKGCCKKQDETSCKEMTEEQKQECVEMKAKWDDWANLTDEVKQELIAKRKTCFDKKREEMKKLEAEMQAHKAKMEEKLAGWETMTLDERKEFFDEVASKCKCKAKTKEGCGKSKEGTGCSKKEKEGCGKHKE
jgi:phage host-nuclease inhibitor protein Gam